MIPDTQMLTAHIAAAGVAAVLFAKSEALAMRGVAAARRILGAPELALPELDVDRSVPLYRELGSWRDASCLSAASGRAPPVAI